MKRNFDYHFQLAVALDKYKADYSILIWDVNAKVASDSTSSTDRKSFTAHDTNSNAVTKPYAEIGNKVYSFARIDKFEMNHFDTLFDCIPLSY